jgi:hypothetical protein
MPTDLAPLPQGVIGAALVVQINDRLRRIALALNAPPDTAPIAAPIVYGTHQDRVSQPVAAQGTLFVETDRGGVIYRADLNAWKYLSGEYADVAAKIPAGLGANDYGFKFFDQTHWRRFEWASTGGAPANASPGWRRAAGEVPTGQISILPFGPGAAIAGGWALCDGTAGVQITQDDATLLSVTTPQLINAYPRGGVIGAYTGVAVAKVMPTISGRTDTAAAGITQGTIAPGDGTPVAGGAVGDPGHFHSLSQPNAAVALPGDPVTNVIVPFFMKR